MFDIEFKNLIFDRKTGYLKSARISENSFDFCGDIWEIEVQNKEKKILSYSLWDSNEFEYVRKSDSLELHWNNGELKVCVELLCVDDKILWNISAQTKKTYLNKIIFPKFEHIDCFKSGKDYLLIPYQSGWILESPLEKFLKRITTEKMPFWMGRGEEYFEADYPTTLNFQFSAYTSENGPGIYLAAEDENAYIKSFVYDTRGKGLSFYMINYPEGMGNTKSYCMPYSFAVCFFKGDYEIATEIYRNWAVKQKWCRKELVEKQIPENLKRINLWRINHTNYELGTRTEEYYETCMEIKRLTGADLAVHWYGWNMGEHDKDYPYYISQENYKLNWDKKLTEWNDRFNEIGIVKIPYVNARLWDKYHSSFLEENAIQFALKDENGNTYLEPWKGDGLISMCPATFAWQKKVTDFCCEYVNNYHFDGIYLDQIASFRATLCFDKTHPHAVGGGSWWNDKYHDLILSVKNGLEKGKFITSESCCETFIDVIDMFLVLDNDISPGCMFSTFSEDLKGAESIPLFSMIYGKHSILYGSICRLSDEKITFEYKFARNILWGFIPSIEGFSKEEIQTHSDYFEIIRNGVTFYESNKELFMYGRVVSLPKIECHRVSLKWHNAHGFTKDYQGIITAIWESKDNERQYVFYNCMDCDATVNVYGQEHTIMAKQYLICKEE